MKQVTTRQYMNMCDDMWSVVFRMKEEGKCSEQIELFKTEAIRGLMEYEITDVEDHPELMYEHV